MGKFSHVHRVLLSVQPYVWDSVGDEWFNYRGYVRTQGAQTFNGVLFGPVIVLNTLNEKAPYYGGVGQMGDLVEGWGRHVGNGLTANVEHGHGSVYVHPRGSVNDSIMEKLNWRIIRYLARDFVGCMDPADANYNPEASNIFPRSFRANRA